MPKVKLAAGFEPALYTMFDGQPCQNRYHNFDDKRDSYPLSAQHRVQFQVALNWLGGDVKNKGITWLNTGKGEAVFAYPSSLPEAPLPYVQFRHSDRSETFKEISGSLWLHSTGFRQRTDLKAFRYLCSEKLIRDAQRFFTLSLLWQTR